VRDCDTTKAERGNQGRESRGAATNKAELALTSDRLYFNTMVCVCVCARVCVCVCMCVFCLAHDCVCEIL
jgi:hypothetical protein